jgi:hypothetical protein
VSLSLIVPETTVWAKSDTDLKSRKDMNIGFMLNWSLIFGPKLAVRFVHLYG